MKFRARDLPTPIVNTKAAEVVQPVIVVAPPQEDVTGYVKDQIKAESAKILLTLEELDASVDGKLKAINRPVKAWVHKIVRYDSGFIKEIISTPEYDT